jgi:hypothetical protein
MCDGVICDGGGGGCEEWARREVDEACGVGQQCDGSGNE